MFYLVLLLGIISVAVGVFVVGFGVPIRETVFGSALLLSGTVAISAGFILIGLAVAVQELRRVTQTLKTRTPAGQRPPRPPERKTAGEAPRPALPFRPAADAAISAPAAAATGAEFAAPAAIDEVPALEPKAGPEWIKRAIAEIEASPTAATLKATALEELIEVARPTKEAYSAAEARAGQSARAAQDAWLRPTAAPPALSTAPVADAAPAPREAPATKSVFNMMWSSDRRSPAGENGPSPERRGALSGQPQPRAPEPRSAERSAELRPGDVRPVPAPPTPPIAVKPMPMRTEPPSVSILKSGTIDEMAYTLFTDGSIEAQMPDGTVRFGSIDELRQHLDRHQG